MIKSPHGIIHKAAGLIIGSFVLFSCGGNKTFDQFQSVSETGWNKDSTTVFNVDINDTTQRYNVFLNIRNGGEYPYQNLWLFINRTGPDSLVLNDTVECYLADLRGKWIGSGAGSTYEVSVLYLQNTYFSKKGKYVYKIRQGMREDRLIGISEVGLMIEQPKEELKSGEK